MSSPARSSTTVSANRDTAEVTRPGRSSWRVAVSARDDVNVDPAAPWWARLQGLLESLVRVLVECAAPMTACDDPEFHYLFGIGLFIDGVKAAARS